MIRCTSIVVALLTLTATLQAQVKPEKLPEVAAKAFRHADLDIPAYNQEVRQLPAAAAEQARQRLSRLGVRETAARVDRRSGRFVTLLPTTPLVPGGGVDNDLRWSDLKAAAPPNRAAAEQAAWNAFLGYLEANQADLDVDLGELSTHKVTAYDDLYQIYVQRTFDSIPVRGSFITAVIGQGNLTLMSTHQWGDRVKSSNRPQLSADEAFLAAESYLSPLAVTRQWGKSERLYVPLANGKAPQQVAVGKGYRYQLAWSVKVEVDGDAGRWEVLVDAHTGEVLANEDQNLYAEIRGGVYPVTNDGIVPDGVEQAGWPMPWINVSTTGGNVTADTGGNVAATGSMTASLTGQFVRISDNCGTSSLTQTDGLDFGTSGGTDCVTPGFGGAGNTHASRTGFYELNKMKEMARGQLPANTWLQQQLTANMNINNTCNAFWNGSTVNFYRSGGGCSNTGEIAGVFDHEWGHGMDANDAVGGIASPSGEGIADVYTALRLNDSCIGRNFQATVCSGNGDPCLTCTGVRDIDYLKRQSGQPHDYTWSNANCGGSVHCVGGVYSEAVWSLWKRKLQSAPYNMSDDTAHEVATRLTFIGAGATSTWFSGGPPNGGCGGSSGYMNYLAADDDNGNLNDGTPHMTAIFQSFNDQEIACQTPAVQDSGCAGIPTSAPIVTASASDKAVDLSWGAVSGATKYQVFRTEGVFACAFGKVKLGETTSTSWSDSGLQNGRQYSYVVIPIGGSNACMGPASSCTNATPASGPSLSIDTGSASTSISGGDSDAYLDNCETGTTTFNVVNTGAGTLTNVRIVSVTPSNPGVTVSTSLPSAISPSTLGAGATGTGSFSFIAGGLSPGETLTLQVEVTANELSSSKIAGLDILSTETDLTLIASQTYSFESGAEGWTTVQGTFGRSSTGGGANGTTWYEQSSANLDNQCDQIQSPVLVLSPTSTLTLWNNFDIEPQFTNGVWYDRANVGIVDATGSRTLVSPDSGRLYNASGPQGTCGTTGQGGWADAATTWGSSSFSATALGSAGFAGQAVQLDVRYGTDASLNGFGFRFDEVTVTDVSSQGPDGQSDSCGCTVDADCDNGLFCDGAEACVAGVCQAGTAPNCDDGVSCTVDACNEGTDSCDHTTSDALCDNGLFCDGAETCNAVLGCQAGTAPNCNDGVGCTVDACNEGTDSCDHTASNALCDNGLFCDGAEICDVVFDCQAGSDPCAGGACDETGDVCLECTVDADCDDGLFCNGAETCSGGSCQAGSDPCPGQSCDETGDVCTNQNGPQDALYDAGLGAPKCVLPGSECDSVALLDGRANLGPEPNQPNTLGTCTDGTSGTYHFDESNDRIVVKTLDGADFVEGATVQVDATVFAWSTGTSDHLDLWFAANANSPVWQLITTINLSSGGLQTLSAQYTLPAGSLQAVRANFRYLGSQSTCSTGSFDDTDDLVFAVNPGPPGGACTVDDDFEDGAPAWTNDPASTCTTGDYVTGDPTNPSGGFQIVGSHSGVTSIFTATNIISAGVDDVDGGNCILGSPLWAVTNASTLSVWYWHGQRDAGDDPSGDFFRLEYSVNGGASWTTLRSNGDSTSNPAWLNATAAIPAGSNVRLRVQCSDGAGPGDLVECGIDDFSICE